MSPGSFRKPRLVRSSELLLAHISALVAERQTLRADGAEADALDRNRVEIANTQWELSYALVERYCVRAEAA